MKTPGATACLFLCTSFRSFLGHGSAHGLLASLFVAVPGRSHSASSRAAKWLLGVRVLEAAELAGGELTSLASSGSVSATFFPEHMGVFHNMAKVARPRALGLTWPLLAVPAGPLARVGAAFAVCCDLFVFFLHRFLFFRTPLPARGTGRELAGLASP